MIAQLIFEEYLHCLTLMLLQQFLDNNQLVITSLLPFDNLPSKIELNVNNPLTNHFCQIKLKLVGVQ